MAEQMMSGWGAFWPLSPFASCISHAEWNLTLESYVVYTNYDEYAIILTKKFSPRYGHSVTAKLYGEGLEPDKLIGVGGGRRPVT